MISACSQAQEAPKQRVPLADPFIMLYNDVYYAYGTSSKDGIVVFTSSDLKAWKKEKNLALHRDDTWGDRWFWAPEVYFVNGQFYMYYSVDEHICVASGDSPLGPFKQDIKKPMIENEKGIDNSLFIDDDGKPYLFFVRFTDGNEIWVAELEDDLKTIKRGTLHSCIHVSQDWEQVWPRVNEGPFVIKHKGVYYMTYSANSYESQYYGVGCATASDITGTWSKYESNPLLQQPAGLVGTGHHCIFKDKEGNLQLVFHAHKDVNSIHPREMYITPVEFRVNKDGNVLYINPEYQTPYQ
ncbi:MAG: glycoside hydrolase family 43 protein [Tannerella sp.]|jgi:beta-xylosidase|nr:glycoside hydrolase family 43 protein [Tannerella sp.]